VDDSRELLDAYVAFLKAATPHEVRAATSARAALEIARTWRPDIVVTDVIMPDMNGLELITHIRSELPPPLPVIVAVSGFPDFEREARHRGAEVFQAKPIDTDDLVALIESLVAHREPPDQLSAHTQARRQAASELARAAVAGTLARRPHFADVARVGIRLLSRYFGDADAAILLMGEGRLRVFAASGPGWPVGGQLEGVLGYALDVVVSGSTLIVPDLAAMPSRDLRPPLQDRRLLAAVPVRSADGVAIGAVALADRGLAPFDVHDLGILEHIAGRLGEIFAGAEGPRLLLGPGVLREDSWRYCLGREIAHLGDGQSLVLALASLPEEGEPAIPAPSRAGVEHLEQAVDRLVERLPPRTALGRLTPATVGAYSVVDDPEAGERALLALLASLEEEPRRACVAMLTATGVWPTDGGAALLDVAHWLLASAMTRDPATALCARISPTAVDRRLAAS
jgi:CheY-like chemotaxis protein